MSGTRFEMGHVAPIAWGANSTGQITNMRGGQSHVPECFIKMNFMNFNISEVSDESPFCYVVVNGDTAAEINWRVMVSESWLWQLPHVLNGLLASRIYIIEIPRF